MSHIDDLAGPAAYIDSPRQFVRPVTNREWAIFAGCMALIIGLGWLIWFLDADVPAYFGR